MAKRNYLYLDFETRSNVDLQECGLDIYAKHSSTKVILLAYALNSYSTYIIEDVSLLPFSLLALLKDPSIIKVAWNAQFERAIFKHVLNIDIPLEQWLDPMIWARHLSLPGSLEDCGKALGLGEDKAKIKEGKRLVKKFCMPCDKGGKVTLFGVTPPNFKTNNTDPADWQLFKEYCIRDVEAERTIFQMMQNTPLPESEQRLWILDQKINERGVPVNRHLVENIYQMAVKYRDAGLQKLIELTKLENPNSKAQMLEWLITQGYTYGNMKKPYLEKALKEDKLTPLGKEVLAIHLNISKTSYTKLERLLNSLSGDDRLRYQFSFLGASRSGRWSGSGVQLQNLPRPIKWMEKNLDLAIKLVSENKYDELIAELEKDAKKPSLINALISLIRSCFQAPEGKKLVVCDLNAIENRVLGWVTGCDAILKVFRDFLDPYMSFATRMYNCAYEDLADTSVKPHKAKNADAAEKRQLAKPVVLGAGYGLGSGVNRFCSKCKHKLSFKQEACKHHPKAAVNYEAATTIDKKTGNILFTGLMNYAENMGVKLTPEQAYKAWKAFREAYPEVVKGWSDLEKAAIEIIKNGGVVRVGPVVFDRLVRNDDSIIMRIKLPSGRYLHYINARLEYELKVSDNGREYTQTKIMYDGIGHGVGQVVKGWGKTYTYGGKLMENIVQAISRDILAHGMELAANTGGADIVLHVHDEIGVESEEKDPFAFCLNDLQYCMSVTPDDTPDLPLHAEGYESKVYKKG